MIGSTFRLRGLLGAALAAVPVAGALAALSWPADAVAAVLTWDNDAGDNDWYNAANWDPDDYPDPSDDLTVDAGSAQTASDVYTDSGGSITIDGPAASAAFGDLSIGHAGPGTLGVRNQGLVLANLIDVGAEGTINTGPGDVRLSAPLVNNGTVNVHQGDTLSLSGEVSGAGNFAGPGTVAFDDRFSPGNSTALVTFEGNVRFGASSTYVCETVEWDSDDLPDPWDPIPPAGPINDRIHLSQADASLGGTLQLRALTKLAPSKVVPPYPYYQWYGSQTRTIVSAEGGGTIQGTFDTLPECQPASWRPDLIDPVTGTTVPGNWGQGHLGKGVFLTRTGPQQNGVEYTPQSTQVHLFQAADGDTNGDRYISGHDIQALVGSDLYGRTEDPGDGLHVWPPDWTHGDFSGDPYDHDPFERVADGLVDVWDIKAIQSTGQPGLSTGEPYDDLPAGQSAEWSFTPSAGRPLDGVADLLLYPEEVTRDDGTVVPAGSLIIDPDGSSLNGYVIRSAGEILTGQEAVNLNLFFSVDCDREISSNFDWHFVLDEEHELGQVVGPEWLLPPAEWDRYFQDLTFTYTVRGTPGIFVGSLMVFSPPAALTSVAGGDFNDPATWDHGAAVPDAQRAAVVRDHGVLTSSDGRAHSLRIDDPAGRVVVGRDTGLQTTTHVEVAQGTLSLAPGATVNAGANFSVDDAGEYVCQLDHTGGGLVAASGNAYLGGTLSLKAVGKLRGPSGDPPVEWYGDQTRTILTADHVLGTFGELPPTRPHHDEFDPAGSGNWGQGHIGRGVFLVDDGPDGQGVTYHADSVVVDLFQACAGDTNGDRYLDGRDISAILSHDLFGRTEDPGPRYVWPPDWPQGDFNGDDLVDGYDVQAILATGLWYTPGPYAAAEPEDATQKAVDPGVDLVLDPNTGGLTLVPNGLTINGYVIRSETGVFTGGPAENLGWFAEDNDFAINGNMGFTLTGQHVLGRVIGPESAGMAAEFYQDDLTFTYTIEGSPGVFAGALIVVPEPGSVALLITGLLAAGWGFRTRIRPVRGGDCRTTPAGPVRAPSREVTLL